jgi:DNA-binding CsgD family transcriptional regulator
MAYALESSETEALGREALDFLEAEGSQFYRAFALWIQGLLHCRHGDAAEAVSSLANAFEVFDAIGHALGIAACLGGFAWAAAVSGDAERGARLFGGAHAIWQADPPREPYAFFRNQVRDRVEPLILETIGSTAFEAALKVGSQMDRHELLREIPSSAWHDVDPREQQWSEQPRALTPRELAVAELVAKGLTNIEIASELVLSRRTVESHVYHIFAKLKVHSRDQVTDSLISRARAASQPPAR